MDWFGYTFLALHRCFCGRDRSLWTALWKLRWIKNCRLWETRTDLSIFWGWCLEFFFFPPILGSFHWNEFHGTTQKIQEFLRNSSSKRSKRGGVVTWNTTRKNPFFAVKTDGLTVWRDAVDPALQEYQTSMATVKVDEVDETMDRLGMWVAHPLPTDITYPPSASIWHLNPPFGDTSKALETWKHPWFFRYSVLGSLDMVQWTPLPTNCGFQKSWPGIYQKPW